MMRNLSLTCVLLGLLFWLIPRPLLANNNQFSGSPKGGGEVISGLNSGLQLEADSINRRLDEIVELRGYSYYFEQFQGRNNSRSLWAMELMFDVGFLAFDFDEFETILGDFNVDELGINPGIANFELGFYFNNIYAGFSMGFSGNGGEEYDSLNVEVTKNQYGLHFGYNIRNAKRFHIIPEVALKWNRFRLINSFKERKIPIEQYLRDRDLDLRINQTTGHAGVRFFYKVNSPDYWSSTYLTLGAYAGYAFKLTSKPWVYSEHNRLTTEKQLELNHFSFGIQFSFFFDSTSY
ncbi:hypothetical protein [Marinilabilia rubra]|uniref:Outer membrane protein beta-barrel domain-containing protein n=1 Tax=Marinilabilia rubra TaxID=2162893 RepID=A0A2U2B8Y5_9BACT|nr:hypothetical protein [Marinilabilia rubra]PWD99539.1 hypothetical protein DDZ16_08775 [Marinilabilia rubra]